MQKAMFSGISRISCSAYNDFLYGNGADNIFVGGAGADELDGGGGTDTADYSASEEAVQISLDGRAGTGGDAEGDKLTTMERLIGSAYADTLTGNDRGNILIGGAGADTLDGERGVDTADYSASD